MLISVACPDTRERQQFVLRVSTLFQRWYRRIDVAQFALRLGQDRRVQRTQQHVLQHGVVGNQDIRWIGQYLMAREQLRIILSEDCSYELTGRVLPAGTAFPIPTTQIRLARPFALGRHAV